MEAERHGCPLQPRTNNASDASLVLTTTTDGRAGAVVSAGCSLGPVAPVRPVFHGKRRGNRRSVGAMCEYCGCRSIELIGRFTEEHYSVIDRLGDLGRAVATGDLDTVGHAGVELANLLWPHTKAEEAGLFHEMRKDEDFTETIDSLCGEHASLDDQLERVLDGNLEEYPAFEKALRNHIDHEENGLFPAAAVSIDGDTWETINQLTHDYDYAAGIEHAHGEHGQGLGERAHAH
ncbi:hypothetical protein GCM10027030_10830 [Luteococcus sediminum]